MTTLTVTVMSIPFPFPDRGDRPLFQSDGMIPLRHTTDTTAVSPWILATTSPSYSSSPLRPQLPAAFQPFSFLSTLPTSESLGAALVGSTTATTCKPGEVSRSAGEPLQGTTPGSPPTTPHNTHTLYPATPHIHPVV